MWNDILLPVRARVAETEPCSGYKAQTYHIGSEIFEGTKGSTTRRIEYLRYWLDGLDLEVQGNEGKDEGLNIRRLSTNYSGEASAFVP